MVRLGLLLLILAMLPAIAVAETPQFDNDESESTSSPERFWNYDQVLSVENFSGPERILSFHSDINIQPDGSITVTERIKVLALGEDIRRGIMREIPTIYGKRHRVLVPFEVISVRRNGKPELFSEYALHNGVGLRIGSASRFLEYGVHEYEISYGMQRQIGFFGNWDELYWNVNGNAWEFGIDSVSCTVHLPGTPQQSEIRTEAYTGHFGSRGADYAVSHPTPGQVYFASTRAFDTYENMTIVVGFPKGLVAAAPASQQFAWWLETNGSWSIALFLLTLVFAYFIIAWYRVGRDPREALVVHEDRPLIGLSAARLRFIWLLQVDMTLITALIMELAQQGYLRLARKNERKWVFSATDRDREGLQAEEKVLLETMFRRGQLSFTMSNDNSHRVQAITRKVERALVAELQHVYYEMNPAQRAIGILLSIAALAVYLTLFGFGYFFFSAFYCFMFMLALFFQCILFYALLPRHTELGRAVLDRIEGFRIAMTGGEDSFGRYQHADEVLQEKYLPYAVALGCNEYWTRRFNRLLTDRGERVRQPDWLSGDNYGYRRDGHFDYSSFATRFPRRLGRAYSHASRPPPPPPGSYSGGSSSGGSTSSGSWGSSSGSGFSSGSSGGSSGGGGGGGGGRGW